MALMALSTGHYPKVRRRQTYGSQSRRQSGASGLPAVSATATGTLRCHWRSVAALSAADGHLDRSRTHTDHCSGCRDKHRDTQSNDQYESGYDPGAHLLLKELPRFANDIEAYLWLLRILRVARRRRTAAWIDCHKSVSS